MRNKAILAFFILLFLCSCSWSQSHSEKVSQKEMDQSELEHFLRTAEITLIEKGKIPGRTNAWKITLFDGKQEKQAHFKFVSFNRPTPIADSYTYELAAYELDKLLDLGRIPPVVYREIDGVMGSLQIRIENCIPLDFKQQKNLSPPDAEAFQNSLEELNVFENLVYCERKELDDVLIEQESWKVFRVDFGEAFNPTPKLIPDQKITRCSKKLFENLIKLEDKVIESKLKELLNEDEASTLLQRKGLIIKTIQTLIQEQGEEAVLF
jgi:hypothetical protein